MSVQIRIAGTADASSIRCVLLASYPVLMAAAYDAALLARAVPAMTHANPSLLKCGTYYLAEIEGEAVGCGGWTPEEPGSGVVAPQIAHIRHFAVSARFTARGIGRAIYARCAEDARTSGMRHFECYSSLNALPFYSALGFAIVGAIAVPMGSDVTFPSVHMRRAI